MRVLVTGASGRAGRRSGIAFMALRLSNVTEPPDCRLFPSYWPELKGAETP